MLPTMNAALRPWRDVLGSPCRSTLPHQNLLNNTTCHDNSQHYLSNTDMLDPDNKREAVRNPYSYRLWAID